MLISKFDLYKHEWLELVFDNRNKDYGAYELREHYAGNMIRAMAVTFFVIALLCAATVILVPAPVQERVIEVINDPIVPPPPIAPVKEIKPPQAAKPIKAKPPTPAAATFKFVPPVVVVDSKADQPVINDKITGAIGTQTTKGPTVDKGPVTDVPPATSEGTGPDVSIHTTIGLDQMPEPNGGLNGWAKFLNKNLRFPPPAQEEGVSGRVILSFVVEKDGSLSSIIVERPAGHGFDEEALRVLKLAKAWKPGIQNGLPVRVKYVIPINFQVTEQ